LAAGLALLSAPLLAHAESVEPTESAGSGSTGGDDENSRPAVRDLTLTEGYRVGDPPPANRLFFRSLTAARVNPLGLLEIFTLSYRSRIKKSDSLILKDNFVGMGINGELSPAFGRIGPMIEIQPLTILRIWAAYQVVGYFGTFNLFQSFQSANDEYSDTVIDELGSMEGDADAYTTTGTQFTAGANFQIKFGPIALRSLFRLVRPDYTLREGDTVFYDQFYDILAPDEGWYLTNDADLLYVTDFGFVGGVRHTLTKAFYDENQHFRPGEGDLGLNPMMHRLGPLLGYTFSKKAAGARFNNPTLLVLVNWWLQHRYRTGEDVSQAFPYTAVAFLFTGDLWVSAKD
jgi:hypothetical protein